MKLFWCPRTRAARALWMLEELGVDFELQRIDIRSEPRNDPPDFRAASPMGKVPALIDGDVMVADSAAICLYLADRYGEGEFAPAATDALRGRYLYWMMFTPGVLEPAMAEKFGGWQPNRHSHGWGDFEIMLTTLKDGLTPGPFLLGTQFTAADVMLGSSLFFLKQFGILPEEPVLQQYLERCLARPAYQRALAKENEDE